LVNDGRQIFTNVNDEQLDSDFAMTQKQIVESCECKIYASFQDVACTKAIQILCVVISN
jgi:hypothetical protein